MKRHVVRVASLSAAKKSWCRAPTLKYRANPNFSYFMLAVGLPRRLFFIICKIYTLREPRNPLTA
jgi:hypothetical protein